MVDRHQHFLREIGPFEELLSRLNLTGREVVEVGLGHGELTRLLLASGAERIVGFEIDEELESPIWYDPRVEVYVLDFREHARARVEFDVPPVIVANPPLYLLDDVLRFALEHRIEDVVLGIPATRPVPAGFSIAFTLKGNAFDPPMVGWHHVVYRWSTGH